MKSLPRHPSRRHRLAAASAAAAAVLAAASAATSSIGTGIGANPIRLAARAEPGTRYRLPAVYVVNTGTQAADYLVRLKRLGDARGRDVPAGWVRFARTHLRLRPHGVAVVPVVLVVPKDAAEGAYQSNVVVGTWTKKQQTRGTALGAAAADELTFTVGGTHGFAWSSWLTYLMLGVVGAGLLVRVLTRGVGFRVRIERRRA